MRLRDGKIWTLLTALYELKGFEEPRGRARPLGAKHGADPDLPAGRCHDGSDEGRCRRCRNPGPGGVLR